MIKMSEVFGLSINKIMVHNGDLSRRETDLICQAVDAYDANQELIDSMGAALAAMTETIVRRDQEIAELKRLVDFDTKAILKDGDTIDDQQQEIAKLEQALKLNDDEIANSEAIKTSIAALTDAKIKEQQQEINKFLELNTSLKSQADRQVKMYNDQVDEIAELKAMVETLRIAAIFTDKEFRHHAGVESFETTVLSEALDARQIMSNSREIMERKMRLYLVGTGDIIMRDPCFPIEIECPDIASVHLPAPGRTYTPNHRNNGRSKFKRPGR